MSYCVNCGVELDESAKKCALCGTPVYNPMKSSPSKETEKIETPFSQNEHIPEGIKHRFIAYVISMVFLIPNIVCFLVNIIFYRNNLWSLYVVSTSFLVWVLFVFPFFTKKLRPYLMWLFDTAAVCLYVFFFFVMGHEGKRDDWFYICALPIIIFTSLLVLAYMLWVKRKKRHWVLRSIYVTAEIALAGLFYGSVIDNMFSNGHAFEVGVIIFVCCVALIAFLVYCYSSKFVRRWLSRKFFI